MILIIPIHSYTREVYTKILKNMQNRYGRVFSPYNMRRQLDIEFVESLEENQILSSGR
jgi:hypothetical protein